MYVLFSFSSFPSSFLSYFSSLLFLFSCVRSGYSEVSANCQLGKWSRGFPSLEYTPLIARKRLVWGSVNGWQQNKKNADVWMLRRNKGGGQTTSEGGEENPPPQRFQGQGCSALTKTPTLRPEVVSERWGVPEHPSCNKSDVAILLGQVKARLKSESGLVPCSSPHLLLILLNTILLNRRPDCSVLYEGVHVPFTYTHTHTHTHTHIHKRKQIWQAKRCSRMNGCSVLYFL